VEFSDGSPIGPSILSNDALQHKKRTIRFVYTYTYNLWFTHNVRIAIYDSKSSDTLENQDETGEIFM